MFPGFLSGSDQARVRKQRIAGLLTVIAAVVIWLVIAYVVPALTPRDPDALRFTVASDSVGPGIDTGSDVIRHGVVVGHVDGVAVADDGQTRISLTINKSEVRDLYQDFVIDFRPKNYFGISAVNIASGGSETTGLVTDGEQVIRNDVVDSTMSTMIDQGSRVASGTMLPSTMNAIRQSLAYADAMQPLIHTGMIVADTVARTQRALPKEQIDRFNTLVAAMPSFLGGSIDGLYSLYNSDLRTAGDDIQNRFAESLKAISDNFFTMVGRLLKSNQGNLTPAVDALTAAAGVLPVIGQGVVTPVNVQTLLTRVNGAFGPGSNGARRLDIKVELDRLPVLQSPLATLENGGR